MFLKDSVNRMNQYTHNNPFVCIVVLNWNNYSDTYECLSSIHQMDYDNYSVILVDNGSTDGSPEKLRSSFPDDMLISNGSNLGYTGGNNVGIEKALELGADYVWLLNNDTVVTVNALKELILGVSDSRDIGLASPLIYFHENRSIIQHCGAQVDWINKRIINLSGDDKSDEGKDLVLWGTALLLSRKVVDEIGILNEGYFAYLEDIEYSTRSLAHGFRNKIVKNSIIYHKDAKSAGGRNSPTRCYYLTRNAYYFWNGNLRGSERIRYIRKYVSFSLSMACSMLDEGNVASAQACYDGLWSAMKGVYGPWDRSVKMPIFLTNILMWHPHFWIGLIGGEYTEVARGVGRRLAS